MKKLLCKVVSTALTVTLTAGLCPVGMEAATNTGKSQASKEVVAEQQTGKETLSYVEGEVLVVTSGGTPKKNINALGKETVAMGATIEDTINFNASKSTGNFQVSLIKSEKYTTEQLLEIYEKSKNVKSVQPNYKYHALDTNYKDYLWGVDNQGQNGGTAGMDINSDSQKVTMAAGEEGKEKVIAIVDTGVDYTHPMLSDYMWNNPNTTYLKGEHGYDFVNGDADPMDDNGHGSHCSGITQSVMNGENIKIMALKFLDDWGYGDTYNAIAAYNYIYTAQQLGTNVVAVNNSWGSEIGENEDELLKQVINLVGEKGAISVCAAGNDAGICSSMPAVIDSPYIVSVAATNEKGELAGFSNYGAETVDIAAPGADILSTVSYNVFNPVSYEEDENGNKELCSTYEDFSGELVTPDVPQVLEYSNVDEDSICYEIDEDGKCEGQSVTLTDSDYFGKKEEDSKALQWEIKGAEEGETYTLYLPYYQEASATPVYMNMMIKGSAPEGETIEFLGLEFDSAASFTIFDVELSEDKSVNPKLFNEVSFGNLAGNMNYWDQHSGQKDEYVEKAGDRAICIEVTAGASGDHTIIIDDFAISKSDVTEDEFGKLAFYNGTSMATPYATGAVAVLANAYPTDTVQERIARIKGSVSKNEALTGMVASGGVLDLEMADQPEPSFQNVTIQENGQLVIQGNFFNSEACISINDQEVKAKSISEKSIVLEGNYYNKNIWLSVQMGETYFEQECYFAKGTAPKKIGKYEAIINKSSMVSDGEIVYCVNDLGDVNTYSENSFENQDYAEISYLGTADFNQIFDNDSMQYYVSEEIALVDGKLYAIAMGSALFSTKAALIRFNMETMEWEKIADLPDAYSDIDHLTGFYAYHMPTLTSYQGKLYLLGGYDEQQAAPVKDVYVYDVNKAQWSKGVSMPEGRVASKAIQVGDKLIVTLGGDGSENCPSNLIFDGKSWKKSKQSISVSTQNTQFYMDSVGNCITYFTGEIALVKNGLLYTDCQAEALGDTFMYQLNEDKYTTTNYSIRNIKGSREICTVALGNKVYILTGVDMDGEQLSNPEEQYNTLIYTIDIQDGRCKVSGQASEGGLIYGMGSYMPGAKVELKAEAKPDYYLKSFTVAGKQIPVQKTKAATTIANISSDVAVKAQFGAYVTKLVPDTTDITLMPGKNQKLNVKVLPENAENKSLTFKSSNTNVVTVDQNGNITANKNAGGKSAEITVYANDRNTVVAKCTVKVTKAKPVLVKKIKLSTKKNVKKVKAGKTITISAKVTPAKATNKKIKWTSSNKKYATVKNGKLTAKKAGIGKKVKITAKAKDGSKVKASITIKIVK